MKKILVLCLVLASVCAFALTAHAEIEINFWNGFTGSDGEILKEIVDNFNATNDKGITIKMDIIPWSNFHEKLPTALATGTAPEMILMGNDVLLTYVNTDSLLPVDDFFEATGFDRSTIDESVWNLFSHKGVQYMIPMQVNSHYLYMNRQLFRDAGLDPDHAPETWDELFEMAVKLTNPEKNVTGFGLPIQSTTVFENLLYCNGGRFIDENGKPALNSEVALKTYTQIQDAMKAGVSAKGATGADYDNILFAGQVAMYINGPWCINGCNTNGLDYSVHMLPAGPAGRAFDIGGCGFAITAGISDEAKAAAYEFMKYWNSTEICKEWSVRNGFPPYLKSVKEDPEVAENPLLIEMSEALQYGIPYLQGVDAAQVISNDILFPLLENILNGADVATELEQAQSAMEMILSE